jgi:hypothetical protein
MRLGCNRIQHGEARSSDPQPDGAQLRSGVEVMLSVSHVSQYAAFLELVKKRIA